MGKDQIPFIVRGYSFLQANQIDLILQEMIAAHWYSQWLPKYGVTIRAEMRTNLDQNKLGNQTALPVKRAIHFLLGVDKSVTPEIMDQIIAAFSDAFLGRMRAILHGANSDVRDLAVVAAVNKSHPHAARTRQPNIIEWQSYPIKAQVRVKKH
jgi:hypothetical protein